MVHCFPSGYHIYGVGIPTEVSKPIEIFPTFWLILLNVVWSCNLSFIRSSYLATYKETINCNGKS